MARADRRRAQRARPAAAARRSDVVIEDTMFFPRLRRHAKWMFLFLATRVRARLRRLRRRRRRRRLRRRPPRRGRWRRHAVDLRRRAARARQPEGRAGVQGPLDGAPGRRQHRRRDRGARRATSRCGRRTPTRCASSPRSTCSRRRRRSSARRSSRRAPTTSRPARSATRSSSSAGSPLDARPDHERREHGATSSRSRRLRPRSRRRRRRPSRCTARSPTLQPNDPSVQLELAQAAQSANDTATTIAAYEAFLKLAPDDPTAPEVRRILKQLRAVRPDRLAAESSTSAIAR